MLAVAVQVGVFFALREKKKKTDDPKAVAAGLAADAGPTAATAADASPIELEPDAAVIAAAADAAPVVPADAAVVARTAIEEETPSERRRRERAEAREEAKREREEARRERERQAAAERERVAAEKKRLAEERAAEKPALGKVTFLIKPNGASLAVDGVFVGKSPLRDVQTTPGSHTVAASAPGYTADTVSFSVRAKQKRTVRLSLKRTPVKPPPDDGGGETVAKRPATPRVSGLGDPGRGRALIGSKCNACHRARGVGSVGPRSRRRGAWERFFKNGYHDRYERLGGLVSRSQLAAVKAYLMENAKCDANAAGEKCK